MNKEQELGILKLIELEQEEGIRYLMNDHIVPHTFSWVVAKRKLTESVAKKYGAILDSRFDWKLEYRELGLFEFARVFLGYHMAWMFPKYWMIRALSRTGRLFRVFYPSWYYEMDGHLLYVNERDWRMLPITMDYTNKAIWEPETTKIVKQVVKPGQVAVDIGASVGYFSLLLARLVGKEGRVISIEPTSGNFKYLRHNIEKNGYHNVMGYKVAAWDKREMVGVMPHSFTKEFVQGVPVDDILESNGIEKIDFIKIDVDGADLKALKGLERTIKRSPTLKMTCEYYPKYLAMAGENPNEFIEFLKKYFDFEVIKGDYEDDHTDHWNLFCVRKENEQDRA